MSANEKVIYDNGSSKFTVMVDGDIVTLVQETQFDTHEIFLYPHEFESAAKFILGKIEEE